MVLIASNKYNFSGDFVNGERTVSSEADMYIVCVCVFYEIIQQLLV